MTEQSQISHFFLYKPTRSETFISHILHVRDLHMKCNRKDCQQGWAVNLLDPNQNVQKCLKIVSKGF